MTAPGPAPDAPDLLEALRRSFETRIAEANARDAARRGQAEKEIEEQERG